MNPLLELLYQALHSKRGIKLSTQNPALTRQELYALRKREANPALDCLEIAENPFDPSELWLVKRGP